MGIYDLGVGQLARILRLTTLGVENRVDGIGITWLHAAVLPIPEGQFVIVGGDVIHSHGHQAFFVQVIVTALKG